MNGIIKKDAEGILSCVDLSEINGKTLLITGASGLLGTYLLYTIDAFIRNGGSVKKVFVTMHRTAPAHLAPLFESDWIEAIRGDLCDEDVLKSLPGADYIIHAAGYGQPAKFSIRQDKTIRLNTAVTFDMLDKLNEGGKFLFISSSGIYNGLDKEQFDETDVGTTNTLHPRACYIEGKRCGEAICNAYRNMGVSVKSARLSYSYGPGVRWDDERALYSFIKKGFGGNIKLLDEGKAERIYCYITDVIEVLWNILLFGREPIYNVGGEEKTTILDLAEIVAMQMGATVSLPEVSNGISGSAKLERLNISKIKNEFGKTGFVPLETGVSRTIQWFREFYPEEIAALQTGD
jgi:nucleoside-diphosphate-sugar epimerase